MNTDLRKAIRIVSTKNQPSRALPPMLSLIERVVKVDDSLRVEVQVTGEFIFRIDALMERGNCLSVPEAAASEEVMARLSHAAYEYLYGDLNRRLHSLYDKLSYLPYSAETGSIMGQIRELQFIYRNKF